jgi:hypothetical protein
MKYQSVTSDFQNGGGRGGPVFEAKGRTGEKLARPEQSQDTGRFAQSENPGNGVMRRRWRGAQPSDGARQVDFSKSQCYAIASALSRQHTTLALEAPDSPRIRPTLPRLSCQTDMPATANTRSAAL